MTTLQLTVTVPDEVADALLSRGLLAPDRLAAMLQREAERDAAIERLFRAADALTALEPALSEEEINAEIEAVRRQRAHRS